MRLYNGDCIEIMKQLIANNVKVDAVITDPPYEVSKHGGTKSKMSQRAAGLRDNIEFMANGFDYLNAFSMMLKLCKTPNLLIFCSNQQISKTMSFFENRKLSTTLLCWQKTNPIPLCNNKYINDIEYIVYVRGRGATFNNSANIIDKYKIKSFATLSKNKLHPTEKPIDLIKSLINVHSYENQLILDPFMGSGTVGDACLQLNRDFIGIEIDKKYFEIANNRILKNLKE